MEPEDTISLVEEAQDINTNEQISLANPTAAILPEGVVRERAEKAHFGLGGVSPGVPSLVNSIQVGDEQYAREAASIGIATKERDARLAMIQNIGLTADPNAPITQNDADLVLGLAQEPYINPNTVFEMAYGNEITNKLVLDKPDSDAVLNQALKVATDPTLDIFDFGSGLIAKQEVIRRKLQDVTARWKNAGIGETVGTVAELFIPGKSSTNISGSLDPKSIALPGNTLEEKIENLWTLPLDQFEATVTAEAERIAQTNLIDAMDFLQQALGVSASEKATRNLFGILDVIDVTGLAAAAVKGVRGAVRAGSAASRVRQAEEAAAVVRARKAPETVPEQAAKAVADTVRANVDHVEPERVVSAMGNTRQAADVKVVQKLMVDNGDIPVTTVPEMLRPLENITPSLFKVRNIFDSSANLSNELASRIAAKLENNTQKFIDSMTQTAMVDRVGPEAIAQAVENAKAEMRMSAEFNKFTDSVIDVVRNPRDPVTNTDSVSLRLGTFTAETFDNADAARLWARDIYSLPDGSYDVGQQGTSFFIDIRKPVSETADNVQDLIVSTNNKTPVPNNMAAQFLWGIRSPSNVTSQLQKSNRMAATFGMEKSLQYVEEIARTFGTLGKQEKNGLNTILRSNRDFIDPASGERGRFYETVSQLEDAYMSTLNRLPTEREIEAYFTYVQLSDYDWILRNTAMYRDKARLGLSQFDFQYGYDGYSEYAAPVFNKAGAFEGKKVDYIPWRSEHLAVLFVDQNGTAKTISRNPTTDQVAMIDDMVQNQGYQIVQVADPTAKHFNAVTGGNQPIQYVVAKTFENTPLAAKQVNYRPGGHVQYKHDYWVKQPRLYEGPNGTWYYEGDVVAFNFSSKAQADKFSKRMDTARKLLQEGNEAGLEAYLAKNLPYSKDSFKSLFDPETGYYDVNNKFSTTTSGQRLVDIEKNFGKESFRDLSKNDYNMTDAIDRTFTGQRDQQLKTIQEAGTNENPVFNMVDAELIDPMPTLARGIGQIQRNRFLGDLKASTADQFVNEFADILAAPLEELRKYPMFFFHNPEYVKGADPARLAAAEATQANAMSLIGHKGQFGRQVEQISEKLLNLSYKVGGDKMANRIAGSALMQTRDPTDFFRGIAFHSYLGLFNPVQWFVQAQGVAHMAAILPQHAAQSMAAYTLQRALLINDKPEILASAAKRASYLGWKEKDFVESYELMKKSGWSNVGRETAYRDMVAEPNLFQGAGKQMLNKGLFFFNEAEKMLRMASWNAAYREIKARNPNRVPDERMIGEILARADVLTVNMTRAGKANWEKGVFSIPVQFASYGIRMTEQMLGGQLTVAEKARVFGMYSALYGVPVGTSAAVAYPFYEDLRTMAVERGWVTDNKVMEALIEGLPAMAIEGIFGKEVNFAQRYGPGGISLIRDLLNDDKTVTEIVLGASGSVVGDILSSGYPAVMGLASVFTEGSPWEPTLQDFIEVSRNVSSVNNAVRIGTALAVGKYFSKKGTYLSDMSTTDAVIAGITGLQPREISDAFLLSRSAKDFREQQTTYEREYVKWQARGLKEASKGNHETADVYFKRARAAYIAGDFRADQAGGLLRQAVREGGISLVEKIKTDFWRRAPGSKQGERLERELNKEGNQ